MLRIKVSCVKLDDQEGQVPVLKKGNIYHIITEVPCTECVNSGYPWCRSIWVELEEFGKDVWFLRECFREVDEVEEMLKEVMSKDIEEPVTA